MTTEKQPIPIPPYDYRGENLRIQITAQNATREAEEAEQCLYMARRLLEDLRKEGDPQSWQSKERIAGQERVVTLVQQQAAAAREHARHAENAARHFGANVPEDDTFEARSRTRMMVQAVIDKTRQARACRDEASRLSGLQFARR
ncbi:hypothetical protein C5615_35955 [Burkholderia cepacia]|uniref:Uncharacterized protein n=1 Tax=Burkholderia cepacia TaxID=292 RepID=A0A2S8I1T2_BURCE|nr:hypothetical protein [Burkholderia cepacia]PQP08750.1 hypothetical protein C5615_35955 [Burkholderia cepacia]HDR9511697.1 hypothetical protein [Burkholderia cepacia]